MHTVSSFTIRALTLSSLLALVGCAEPCDGVVTDTRPSTWAGHEELVPPGATLCSADERSGLMDLETEQNPFVKIVEHYEAQGWERVSQDTSDEQESVSFVRGESRVDVLINEENRTYSRVVVMLAR